MSHSGRSARTAAASPLVPRLPRPARRDRRRVDQPSVVPRVLGPGGRFRDRPRRPRSGPRGVGRPSASAALQRRFWPASSGRGSWRLFSRRHRMSRIRRAPSSWNRVSSPRKAASPARGRPSCCWHAAGAWTWIAWPIASWRRPRRGSCSCASVASSTAAVRGPRRACRGGRVPSRQQGVGRAGVRGGAPKLCSAGSARSIPPSSTRPSLPSCWRCWRFAWAGAAFQTGRPRCSSQPGSSRSVRSTRCCVSHHSTSCCRNRLWVAAYAAGAVVAGLALVARVRGARSPALAGAV